jgi:hypothetical protein
MPQFVRSSEISLTPDIAHARSGSNAKQGSVWFSALIFRYPTESRYSPPLCPAYFLANDSSRHPCGNHCYRIYYRI